MKSIKLYLVCLIVGLVCMACGSGDGSGTTTGTGANKHITILVSTRASSYTLDNVPIAQTSSSFIFFVNNSTAPMYNFNVNPVNSSNIALQWSANFTSSIKCMPGQTLLPQMSCELQLNYTPTVVESSSIIINATVNSKANDNTSQINSSDMTISYNSINDIVPSISLISNPSNLSRSPINQTTSAIITITNNDSNTNVADLQINDVSLQNSSMHWDSSYDRTSKCQESGTLSSGTSCTLRLMYIPSIVENGSINIAGSANYTNSQQQTVTFSLPSINLSYSSYAESQPNLQLTVAKNVLSAVTNGGSDSTIVTITNQSSSVTFNNLQLTDPSSQNKDFSWDNTYTAANLCATGQSLAPNTNCSLKLVYNPTVVTPSSSLTLTGGASYITTGGSTESYIIPANFVTYSSTAAPTPNLQLAVAKNVLFAVTNSSSDSTIVTISNESSSTAVNNLQLSDPHVQNKDFSWDNTYTAANLCVTGQSLAPNSNCSLKLLYTPTVVTESSTLTLTGSASFIAADGSTKSYTIPANFVTYSSTAKPTPNLSITFESPAVFESMYYGESYFSYVTIKNNSEIMSVYNLSTNVDCKQVYGFHRFNACVIDNTLNNNPCINGQALLSNQSCNLGVRYIPSLESSYKEGAYIAGGAPGTVTLNLSSEVNNNQNTSESYNIATSIPSKWISYTYDFYSYDGLGTLTCPPINTTFGYTATSSDLNTFYNSSVDTTGLGDGCLEVDPAYVNRSSYPVCTNINIFPGSCIVGLKHTKICNTQTYLRFTGDHYNYGYLDQLALCPAGS